VLKRYVSTYPTYSLTVRVNDGIVNVKFANGVFETEDPRVQEAIESNQFFGAAMRLAREQEKPKQKGVEKRMGPHHFTDHDPLAKVLFEETNKKEDKDAKEDGRKAKKAGKKKGSKGKA